VWGGGGLCGWVGGNKGVSSGSVVLFSTATRATEKMRKDELGALEKKRTKIHDALIMSKSRRESRGRFCKRLERHQGKSRNGTSNKDMPANTSLGLPIQSSTSPREGQRKRRSTEGSTSFTKRAPRFRAKSGKNSRSRHEG